MGAFIHEPLAAAASTGDNTHTGVHASANAYRTAVEFTAETVGATPTVTYKVQGCFDDDNIADDDAGWFDLNLTPSDDDTAAATFTVTAAGTYTGYVAEERFCRRVRLVTSSNTAVTYHANLRQQIAP